MIGYKVEIPISDSWVLKKGQLLANGWDLKCFGVGRSCLPGKKIRCDIIKTKRWYTDSLKCVDSDKHCIKQDITIYIGAVLFFDKVFAQ